MQHNKKIFVVDDDLFSLNLYRQELENLGQSDISTFQNGSICLYNLFQKPTIVFLDYYMNDISGLEVLKKIKRFDPKIHVVMISGQENAQVAVEAMKFGAFDYLVKGDNEGEKISKVLTRISTLEGQLKKSMPSFFQRFFSTRSAN